MAKIYLYSLQHYLHCPVFHHILIIPSKSVHIWYLFFNNIYLFTWLYWVLAEACGDLVPRTGMKPSLPALLSHSVMSDSVTLRTIACQAPLSMGLFQARILRKKESEVTQSCLTLCDPMDYRLPGSSIHGIFQARILKWVAIPSSRGSSQPKDQTWVSCITGRFFTIWATGEALHWKAKISTTERPGKSQTCYFKL